MITRQAEAVTLTPGLAATDAVANFWLRQATVRLRREICWCWRERTGRSAHDANAPPPLSDRPLAALDISRHWEAKHQFFQTDVTASYLSGLLCDEPPPAAGSPQGSFGWVTGALNLDDVSAFVLALSLADALDGAMGPAIAACLNDSSRTRPTLELAQKLWDRPAEVMGIADDAHPLRRCGLLTEPPAGGAHEASEWDRPLIVPPLLSQRLLFPGSALPGVLATVAPEVGATDTLSDAARLVARRLASEPAIALRVVPVCGPRGSPGVEVGRAISAAAGRPLAAWRGGAAELAGSGIQTAAALCWLSGHDLFLSHDEVGDNQAADRYLKPLQAVPICVFLGIRERADIGHLPAATLLPCVDVARLTYRERIGEWRKVLGSMTDALDAEVAECARRFRYEKETIRTVARGLHANDVGRIPGDLLAACRAELPLDMGDLAQEVTPRFAPDELVLPYRERLQFEDVFRAMASLTEVHYGWGTAKAWNEGGISVLFAGPSGTGKTMAAEVLAKRLDLPMYRIDLSQVVNKYIGETEKNLKRLFDAADMSDTLLLFDEADALFGKRSEVKDAHDRYANLEISYLLERMERFKGLAILATNRKKDLDEAFLRRLRYVIDFPLPERAERKRIWIRAIPEGADASALDFDFLAGQFQLAGGHIRSLVFNACLQAAGSTGHVLTMERMVMAVKREYDKLNRSVGLEAFGPYAGAVERMERG